MSHCISQNLPALLNDPNKGKQKDFFTRNWGDSFTENRPIPNSPQICELPQNCFDRYLKKIRRHQKRQEQFQEKEREQQQQQQQQHSSPTKKLPEFNFSRVDKDVSRVFLDPNFDLSRPETFNSIFNISQDGNFSQQVKSSGRLVQEKLSHQLDLVEVSIANQVAQKSHNFFQVMTYHDALMTQLKALVEIIKTLRSRLKSVDEHSLRPAIELFRLKRRLENMNKVLEKLPLMSYLHEAQPTINLMISSEEFSGALDLIKTSCQILSVDLKGVKSFQHLTSQLTDIEFGIGKILLKDFTSFIESELMREIVHVKATSLSGDYSAWTDLDSDRLSSVVFGLLRQNSFSFLENLEDASFAATKKTLQDVIKNIVLTKISAQDSDYAQTASSLVTIFARQVSSHDWVDLFDVMSGSLLVLLNRISVIHGLIRDAIHSVNNEGENNSSNSGAAAANNPLIPESQMNNLLATTTEVLINICDQMHERGSKYLSLRSKTEQVSKLITVEELTSIGLIVSIFSEETRKVSGKNSTKLQLCHKSQSVMFIQSFHEECRVNLNKILDSEIWRKSENDFHPVISRLTAIPSMRPLFQQQLEKREVSSPALVVENGVHRNGSSSSSPPSPSTIIGIANNNNNNNIKKSEELQSSESAPSTPSSVSPSSSVKLNTIGQFVISGSEVYIVCECVVSFLKILAEYCNLCSMLPSVTIDIGLKAAELIKFFNSRICQLLIGAGAINISGLKTITLRNLGLAARSVQLVRHIVPFVLIHFESCYSENSQLPSVKAVNGASPGSTKAESRQFETLQKQFDKAVVQMKDHVEELHTKIFTLALGKMKENIATWQPSKQIPSNNFKALCKTINKLYDSVADVFTRQDIEFLFLRIHNGFLQAVHNEIRMRNIQFDSSKARTLQTEMTFYGQCLLRLDVLPISELHRERFEALWRD